MIKNSQPTSEQIKEFWEWCGFKQLPVGKSGFHYEMGVRIGNWMPPDAHDAARTWESLDYLPKIDLNNLFKYAVPKVEHCLIDKETDLSFRAEANSWYEYNENPALALFWVIWEVIKKGK